MAKKIKKKDIFAEAKSSHKVWHKFSNWLVKTYGKGLHGKWRTQTIKDINGKIHKLKSRSFNDFELSKRLVGYEVQLRVERYVKRYCPEIKIVGCDDDHYASSDLLLIPHPNHGITIIFIPQCTHTQNQFFLYGNHHKILMKELKSMKYVYGKD